MTIRRRACAEKAARGVAVFVGKHRMPPTIAQLAFIIRANPRTARRWLRDARTLGLVVEGPWPVGVPLPGTL